MGGLMKMHHHQHQHHHHPLHHNGVGSNGNNRAGKPYGLMIMLAFGAAIIGVMALHKVRERRVINLLVQQKDSELTSLHLLLQKEREHARETKWKLEEMKTKLHSLRAQKRGLDNRIAEMQSIISSLREEQRTIESALDEKQNEIKMNREKDKEASNDNPQVLALSEMLRQKESEVEDLRSRLQTPMKVWSVSTDDPSSANVNLQNATSVTERDYTRSTRVVETNAALQGTAILEAERNASEIAESGSEPAEFINEQNATQGKETTKHGGEIIGSDGNITEQTDKVDNPKQVVSEHGNGNFQEGNAEEEHNSNESQTGVASIEEEKNSTQIQTVGDHDNEGPRFREEIHKWYFAENGALHTTNDGLQAGNSNFQGAENKDSEMKYKGGRKLEKSNQPKIGRNRLNAGDYLRKNKRKKLSKNHKSRKNIENSIKSGTAATINPTYTDAAVDNEMDRGGYQGTLPTIGNHYKGLMVENGSGLENHEVKTDDELSNDRLPVQDISEQEVKHGEERNADMEELGANIQKSEGISQGSQLLRHDEDAQELSKKKNATSGLEVEKRVNTTSISTELDHMSLKEKPANTILHFEDETLLNKQQNNFEPKYEANNIEQPEERTDAHYKAEADEQTDPINNDDKPENLQMEDDTQTEPNIDASKESALLAETDGKGSSESLKEPEF